MQLPKSWQLSLPFPSLKESSNMSILPQAAPGKTIRQKLLSKCVITALLQVAGYQVVVKYR